MSVGPSRGKPGRHSALELLPPGIGDERELALEHVDELILLGVPVKLDGLGARLKAREAAAEVREPRGVAQAPAVAPGHAALVRLRVAGDRLLGHLRRIEGGQVEFRHGQFPARMLITAMRTAMPKVTCGRITECGPSATEESISTPRFIGPGRMTMASYSARASFCGVKP